MFILETSLSQTGQGQSLPYRSTPVSDFLSRHTWSRLPDSNIFLRRQMALATVLPPTASFPTIDIAAKVSARKIPVTTDGQFLVGSSRRNEDMAEVRAVTGSHGCSARRSHPAFGLHGAGPGSGPSLQRARGQRKRHRLPAVDGLTTSGRIPAAHTRYAYTCYRRLSRDGVGGPANSRYELRPERGEWI